MTENIDCRNCAALCCGKGQIIDLTDAEADYLTKGGTMLSQQGVPKEHKRRRLIHLDAETLTGIDITYHGIYVFLNNCGYITKRDYWSPCGIYDDSRKPERCGEFPMGGSGCRMIREAGSIQALIKQNRLSNRIRSKFYQLFDPVKNLFFFNSSC